MARIRAFEDNANSALPLGQDAGPDPHVFGPGGGRRGDLRGRWRRKDHITSTHRGHGHCVANGRGTSRRCSCEFARQGGGLLPRQGRLDAQSPTRPTAISAPTPSSAARRGIATGAALSAKRLGSDAVTVCFFGDCGRSARGCSYEVMNMAALWNLPVIYACENNHYGEYTKTEEVAGRRPLRPRRRVRLEAHQVDGQDVLAVNALRAGSRGRAPAKGEGPRSSSCSTPTATNGHHVGDINRRLLSGPRRRAGGDALEGHARPDPELRQVARGRGHRRRRRARGDSASACGGRRPRRSPMPRGRGLPARPRGRHARLAGAPRHGGPRRPRGASIIA